MFKLKIILKRYDLYVLGHFSTPKKYDNIAAPKELHAMCTLDNRNGYGNETFEKTALFINVNPTLFTVHSNNHILHGNKKNDIIK